MERGVSFASKYNWFWLSTLLKQSILFLFIFLGLLLKIEFQRSDSPILLGDVAEVACVVDDYPIVIVDDSGTNKVMMRLWIFHLQDQIFFKCPNANKKSRISRGCNKMQINKKLKFTKISKSEILGNIKGSKIWATQVKSFTHQ